MKLKDFSFYDSILIDDGKPLCKIGFNENVVTYSEFEDIHEKFNLDFDIRRIKGLKLAQKVFNGNREELIEFLSGKTSYSGSALEFTIDSDLPETEGLNGTRLFVLGTSNNGVRYSLDELRTTEQSNCIGGWIKTIASGRDQHGNILIAMPYNGQPKLKNDLDPEQPIVVPKGCLMYSRDGMTWNIGAQISSKIFAQKFCVEATFNGLFLCTCQQCSNYLYVTKNPSSNEIFDSFEYTSEDLLNGWYKMKISDTSVNGALAIMSHDHLIYVFESGNVIVIEYDDDGNPVQKSIVTYEDKGGTSPDSYTTDGLTWHHDAVNNMFKSMISCQDKSIMALIHDIGKNQITAYRYAYKGILPRPTFDVDNFHPKSCTFFNGKFYLSLWEKEYFQTEDFETWKKIEFQKDIKSYPELSSDSEGGLIALGDSLYLISNIICKVTQGEDGKYVLRTKGNIHFIEN